MEKWSNEAWHASLADIQRIKQLSFIHELADGTLSEDIFRYYISQDCIYINNYTRVLAHIASRLPDMVDVDTFMKFAIEGVAAEKELHAMFNPDYSICKSYACELYTSFLKAKSYDDIAVEVAAVLPCFWVYSEICKYILSIAHLNGNPYKAWIETYTNPIFDISTAKVIDVCNRLASSATGSVRNQMTKAFVDATRLEYLFWYSAYHKGEEDLRILI